MLFYLNRSLFEFFMSIDNSFKSLDINIDTKTNTFNIFMTITGIICTLG